MPKTGERYRNIAFLTFDGVQSLDMTGPLEVFAAANQFCPEGLPRYRTMLVSQDGRDVTTNAGLRLTGLGALSELRDNIDTFLVSGGSEPILRAAASNVELKETIRAVSANARRTGSICVGALVLADCGLLDNRRATTHWRACSLLSAIRPQVQVEPASIYVSDPPFYTSGGVTAGIDLCLALVEADMGSAVAVSVAKELLLFMRRPGGQSQFSSCLERPANSSPAIDRLILHIQQNPTSDLSLSALASVVGMSDRTLSRRFKAETGISPVAFVEAVRIEQTKSFLEGTEWSLARVAERSGWQSLSNLHRAFLARVGITPQAYRERFGVRSHLR
jgi:transcriptional regulator GlxA family with amidase domain